MHTHFVCFSMNDISKCFMMLNNAQLHNLMSDREKLRKEVKRKAREASDFQVKVGEMKRNEASPREIVRDGGGSQGKAPGEPSTKGADSPPSGSITLF